MSSEYRDRNEINVNDWVLSIGDTCYSSLVGRVCAIDKYCTPAHETNNPYDDIHIDFKAIAYSPERVTEIEKTFQIMLNADVTFDDLPLDDVIMSPDMLLKLVNMSYDDVQTLGNNPKLYTEHIHSKFIFDTQNIDDITTISA